MKARYDDNMIPVAPRFERALIELMVAQCEILDENSGESVGEGHRAVLRLCRIKETRRDRETTESNRVALDRIGIRRF